MYSERASRLRQVSGRSSRSKSWKPKIILQVATLFVVTVWLLFQLNHSFKKKNDQTDEHLSERYIDDEHEMLKLGRKVFPQRDSDSQSLGGDEQLNDEQEMHQGDIEVDAIDEHDLVKDDDFGEIGDEFPENYDNVGEGDETVSVEDEEHVNVSHETNRKNFGSGKVSNAVFNNVAAIEKEGASPNAGERSSHADSASNYSNDSHAMDHVFQSDDSSNRLMVGDLRTDEGKNLSSVDYHGPLRNETNVLPASLSAERNISSENDADLSTAKANATSDNETAIPEAPATTSTSSVSMENNLQGNLTSLWNDQTELFANLTNTAQSSPLNNTTTGEDRNEKHFDGSNLMLLPQQGVHDMTSNHGSQ